MESSNSAELLNYSTDLHNKKSKELMLISSIIKVLSENNENSIVNDQNNLLPLTCFLSTLNTLNIVEPISISLINATATGSSSGKYYIGQCYDHSYDVIKRLSHSFNWYLKSAEEGNASGQNAVGYCTKYGEGTLLDEEKGNYL
ncbi:3689_t:CDS:2, partial [Cetraspora pellucida]